MLYAVHAVFLSLLKEVVREVLGQDDSSTYIIGVLQVYQLWKSLWQTYTDLYVPVEVDWRKNTVIETSFTQNRFVSS